MKVTQTIERIGVPMPIKLVFPNDHWEECGQVIAADMSRNILTQKQASGASLKRNARSTLESKRRRGKPLLALIDRGRRLVHTSQYEVEAGGNQVAVWPKHRQIARWVQEKGYVGWVAPSRGGIAALKQLFREQVEKAAKRAARVRKKR